MKRLDWADRFYRSKRWKDFRLALIRERGIRCEMCGKMMRSEADIQADHIQELTPESVNDINVSFNPANIQLLCADCHSKKHKRFGHEQQRVVIVYGAPCSGKAEYVRRILLRGDIVLDFDSLYSAVSGCGRYDKPDNIRAVVFRMRDAAIDAIKTRLGKWNTAYIIGGYPSKAERENLARTLSAELVFIDKSQVECEAQADARCGIHAPEMRRYIRNWFERFEP